MRINTAAADFIQPLTWLAGSKEADAIFAPNIRANDPIDLKFREILSTSRGTRLPQRLDDVWPRSSTRAEEAVSHLRF